MIGFRRRGNPFMLVVGMAGVKLGDSIVQIGCAHGGRLAAVAREVGLSGRAVAVVADDAAAARVQKAASEAGVLVELEISPPGRLPLEEGTFDLAILDDSARQVASMSSEDRLAAIRETWRILRPGGRIMVIGTAPRTGLAAWFSSGPGGPRFDPAPSLEAEGFKSPRILAERDGLAFVEASKPRLPA